MYICIIIFFELDFFLVDLDFSFELIILLLLEFLFLDKLLGEVIVV